MTDKSISSKRTFSHVRSYSWYLKPRNMHALVIVGTCTSLGQNRCSVVDHKYRQVCLTLLESRLFPALHSIHWMLRIEGRKLNFHLFFSTFRMSWISVSPCWLCSVSIQPSSERKSQAGKTLIWFDSIVFFSIQFLPFTLFKNIAMINWNVFGT